MGGPKGCKAFLGTDKMAAATLTNMLMTARRSSDDDEAETEKDVLLSVETPGQVPCRFCSIKALTVARMYAVSDVQKGDFIF